MKKYVVLGLMAVALAACGSPKKVPLQGERISILQARESLDAGVYKQDFTLKLPQPTDMDWEQSGGSSAHVGRNAKVEKGWNRVWKRKIGGSSEDEKLLNQPVVGDGKLFVVNPEGEVLAINAQTGKKVWKKRLKTDEKAHLSFSGGVAYNTGDLFVTSGIGDVFALNANSGEILWTSNIGVPVRAAPTVAEDTVFVVGHNDRMFALDAVNGALKWTHSGIEEELVLIGGSSVAAAGGLVVVPYASGEVYVLTAKDGRYLWHDALALNVGADPLSALVDVEAAPVIAGGLVFAVNHNGQLTAFDITQGLRVWERELSAVQMPWVVGNALFVMTEEGKLVALENTTGEVIWVSDVEDSIESDEDKRSWAGPVMVNGNLAVASSDGKLVFLTAATGDVIEVKEVGGEVKIAPIVASNLLYILDDDGRLSAFK